MHHSSLFCQPHCPQPHECIQEVFIHCSMWVGFGIVSVYNVFCYQLQSMGERKAWSQQEDAVLKVLYEQRKMSKWSQIAKAMNTQFKMAGRNGKQCRERYHNHLDSSIKKEEWSQQELDELVRLHNSIGNRWAEISRSLPGRSQNCVKNKLYSVLRRGLKCINSAIKSKLKRYKQLQISIVYKIVEACENKYHKKTLTREMLDILNIKKQIIYYGIHDHSNTSEDIAIIKNLIDQIKNFSKATLLPNPNPKHSAPNSNPNPNPISVPDPSKEDVSLHSEEVQSSQFRDNIADLRADKKTSLHSLMMPMIPQEQEPAQTKPSLWSSLNNVKKLSSKESNRQVEQEVRAYDLLPGQSLKSFEFQQYDNLIRSPRPLYYGDSPYFDELRQRNSFNSWSQFLPQ